ncbi:MAG: hypothetical protein WBM28_00790, partial [Burkholderiales bacterium]
MAMISPKSADPTGRMRSFEGAWGSLGGAAMSSLRRIFGVQKDDLDQNRHSGTSLSSICRGGGLGASCFGAGTPHGIADFLLQWNQEKDSNRNDILVFNRLEEHMKLNLAAIRLLAALLGTGWLLLGSAQVVAQEPIRIGAFLSVTGPAA